MFVIRNSNMPIGEFINMVTKEASLKQVIEYAMDNDTAYMTHVKTGEVRPVRGFRNDKIVIADEWGLAVNIELHCPNCDCDNPPEWVPANDFIEKAYYALNPVSEETAPDAAGSILPRSIELVSLTNRIRASRVVNNSLQPYQAVLVPVEDEDGEVRPTPGIIEEIIETTLFKAGMAEVVYSDHHGVLRRERFYISDCTVLDSEVDVKSLLDQ